LENKNKNIILNIQKISGKFLFYFWGVVPFFQFFSGKISVTALTPLYSIPKYPYLRGDTGGGGVHPYTYGGV